MVANSSEPFVVQYNLRWIVVFPIYLSWNLSRKKPCSTSSSEKMCLRCFQLDAGSPWSFKSFREYVHISTIDGTFNLPKAAVSVVVCPLTALIDAHIKELRDHANLANKNYCRSIRRKENSEILHSRKLIGLFKAISIFLTSMEEVILLGLPGTTKSSLTWNSGGNTFSFCLNKDLGGTLGRELNVDFFANFCGNFTLCPRAFPVLSFLSAPWASDQPSL